MVHIDALRFNICSIIVPNEACSLARDDDRVQDKEIITFTEIG
jgi:hypothetical protein